MKKLILALAAVAMLAVPLASASAQTILRVADPTPTGTFTDAQGNAGYGEVRDDGIRACNENPGTPAGDNVTGYAWIDAGGDANAGHNDDDADGDGITYGNGTVGAGDYDGEGTGAGEDANGNGQLDSQDTDGDGVIEPGETEDTDGDGRLDTNENDCPE